MSAAAASHHSQKPPCPVRGGLAGWQLRRLRQMAQGDLRGLTAGGLAAEVKLTPYHFSRAFAVSMGVTPGRWLTRLRIERAQALLEARQLTISEVARSVGYKGAPQLRRAFRLVVGETPREFLRC